MAVEDEKRTGKEILDDLDRVRTEACEFISFMAIKEENKENFSKEDHEQANHRIDLLSGYQELLIIWAQSLMNQDYHNGELGERKHTESIEYLFHEVGQAESAKYHIKKLFGQKKT